MRGINSITLGGPVADSKNGGETTEMDYEEVNSNKIRTTNQGINTQNVGQFFPNVPSSNTSSPHKETANLPNLIANVSLSNVVQGQGGGN